MTYALKDKSVHDGAPIECYEFIAPHKTWRFTSFQSEVTVVGQVYTPLPITRTGLETSNVIDGTITMDFNIPADSEMAKDFCFAKSPRSLRVVVRRVHDGDDFLTDYSVEWDGTLVGATALGNWGVIKTGSVVQSKLSSYLSSVFYQRNCNHVLYDARCKAIRADFTETAVVTKIQGQIITVDDMVFANDELILGEMTNTRTGEAVGIISNTANVIRIGVAFFDIVVGDTVELTRGCDHMRLGDCKTVFDNVDNYGGFDHVPEVNPFEKLDFTARTIITTKVKRDYEKEWKPPLGAEG